MKIPDVSSIYKKVRLSIQNTGAAAFAGRGILAEIFSSGQPRQGCCLLILWRVSKGGLNEGMGAR